MILTIQAKGFSLTDGLKGSVESHLRFLLTRYRDVIERVDVTLSDINGSDKGGIDKRCLITLKLIRSKSIVIQVTEADLYDSIQYCSYKLHRAITRHLGKKRRFHRERIHISDLPQEAA